MLIMSYGGQKGLELCLRHRFRLILNAESSTGGIAMKVNQLAKELGTTADTVRYYTRRGLLSPAKGGNGYKEYSAADYRRLRFILTARQLGFSVEDVSQILGEADQGQSACPTVRRLITERLHEVDRRFHEMAALRVRMLAAIEEWNTKPDQEPNSHTICHLIDGFLD